MQKNLFAPNMKMSLSTKFLTFVIIAASFWACKEIPPFINYSPDIELTKDTCYVVTDIPAKEEKSVLIEDVSGVRCVNCPEAAEIAHELKKDHPGRVVVVTLHPTSNANLTTTISGNDTLNSQEAENIYQNLIGGAQGLPTGSVDRKKYTGESRIAVSPTSWTGYTNDQMATDARVNLELNITASKADRTAKLDVKTTFTEEDASPVFLTIMVLESELVQPQITRSGQVDDYVHHDILRYTHTNYSGLKLADDVTKGLVCEKGFELTIPEKYNLDHVAIAVMVNKVDADNKEILQVKEVLYTE